MKDQDKLKEIMDLAKKGTKYPAVKLVNDNPELAAAISKLIKPKDKSEFDIDKPTSYYALNQSQIETLSNKLQNNIKDNKNIIELFPDIELAIQILVSSILSPKDMVNNDIIYKNKELVVNSELSMKINTVIKNTMDNKYKLHERLEEMLRDMLFDTGSYIETAIPESIVDQVINSGNKITTESLTELFTEDHVTNLGILGNSDKVKKKHSLESLLDYSLPDNYNSSLSTGDDRLNKLLEPLIDVTDNYKLLKLPKVLETVSKQKIKSVIAKESLDMSNAELSGVLYKNDSKKSEQFMVFPSKTSANRKSVGKPLVIKLPTESVIPVHIPGDESKHVGYFVLIDIDGNPVTTYSSRGDINSGLTALNRTLSKDTTTTGEQTLSSALLTKAKNNLVGNNEVITLDHITKVYTSIIEKDLLDRLKNGVYNTDVSISNDQEIYRVMLARALAGSFTRLVYIPEELMTYFAFKYHENGIGKSLLDDIKILTSLRAIIMFSKVMALTKSSIALTRVNMTLDPNDPDPQKTIELASHEIAKTRQQYFPLGINSPVDLVDWIQRAGFEFTFEGHPGLPETKFDFETKNIQHELPDSDLDELLRKQTYMAFGLSPEMVDNGFEGDFATTIVSNNILLAKRILQLQVKFSQLLSRHVRKIVNADPLLQVEIKEIITSNKDQLAKYLNEEDIKNLKENEDEFIQTLIERHVELLELELPKPDGITLSNLSEAYNEYKDSLEDAIEAWISTESLDSSIAGEISDNIDAIKSVVTNYFLRKWMVNNGYMSELSEITSMDEDGEPSLNIYDISKTHLEGLIKSSITFVENLLPTKYVTDKKIEELDDYDGSETSTSSTEPEEETEEEMGGEEFNFEEEPEEPTEEETETEEPETEESSEEPVEK